MNFEIIDDKTTAEFEAFIQSHPKGHFAQSRMWGNLKDSWKWCAVATRDPSGAITGGVSALVRKLPGLPYRIMYACRGPVCDVSDRDVVCNLVDGLKHLAKMNKCYTLKIDPDILSENTEFLQLMQSFGFKQAKETKNFETIQPRYVFRLDINGKDAEQLMAGFESKTRYNIRLAERKGVEIKLCGKEVCGEFSEIMNETGQRDGFVVRNREYFEKMLDCMGEHARIYMAYHEGRPIAGVLPIWFGDKVWYLYGASSNEHRNLMPNYLLQWSMIQWGIEKGCAVYDFRGVSGDISEDNPLYGLYRFKKGFGGDFCEFVGELDCVFKPWVNFLATKLIPAFKNVRRKLFLKR